MAQHWTFRLTRTASMLGGVYRTSLQAGGYGENDADARRMRIELEAIRARFPDHA